MLYFEYGTTSGTYTDQTTEAAITTGTPLEEEITGLLPDTLYFYRMNSKQTGAPDYTTGDEYTFHTQRASGSDFVFTIQSDSHQGDSNFNEDLYHVALQNQINDDPDFLIDVGDTFMTEKFYPDTEAGALDAAADYRPHLGIIGTSAPVFLGNGNHEGELGWNLDGTSENMAIWATNARHHYYATPVSGGFYSGSTSVDPDLGAIRDGYFAWTWGYALIVVLDPFWYTTSKPGDPWNWTLGYDQFTWFKNTLEGSNARFKFVLLHNLFGTSNGKGGMENAHMYEWGGYDSDGITWGFDTNRSGWGGTPIHQLMVDNDVQIVFHGHDHVFVKQDHSDGIVYQTLPQVSLANFTNGISMAENAGYDIDDPNNHIEDNAGHLRVTVAETEATVEYVRAFRPEDTGYANGEISYTYTVDAIWVCSDDVLEPEGDCDDADVCTVDSCDEVLGCVHDRICGPLVPSASLGGRVFLGLFLMSAGALFLVQRRRCCGEGCARSTSSIPPVASGGC